MSNKHLFLTSSPQTIQPGDVTFGGGAIPASSITDGSTKAPVQALIQLQDLSDAFGFTYNSGTKTLTANFNYPINVALRDIGITNLLVTDRVLVIFEVSDQEAAGIYRLTNLGAPDPYSGVTSYSTDDVVTSGGIIWKSKGDSNSGHTPLTSPGDWDIALAGLTAATGATAYSSGTTYAAGAIVGAGGFYISRANGNVGNNPSSSPNFWSPLGSLGDFNSIAAPMSLVRTTDFNSASTIVQGSNTILTRGTMAGTVVFLTNTSFPIVLDTTPLIFQPAGGGGTTYSAGNGINISGDTISVRVGGASALQFSGPDLTVNTDGTAIVTAMNALTLNAGGITGDKLAGTIAGPGLGHNGTELSVNADGSTLEVSSDAVRMKDGGSTRAKLAVEVANSIALTGFAGTVGTTNSSTGTAVNLVFPTNTISMLEIIVVASNDADTSMTFAQKGFVAYRRDSGNVFPVGDTEDVLLLPAFATTGTGSIAGITWFTSANGGGSGTVAVNVTGPGGGLNVTYKVRVRLL